MSAITDFAGAVNASFDEINETVGNISSDVTDLLAKIEELQNTPGGITQEDQALLNDIQARSQSIASSLKALDEVHPPTPPVEPEPEA
jgi:outer membrane murein-binding lipoprotein Lpp